MPVLRTADEIGNLVAVKVHHRRADVVPFDVLRRQQAHVFEEPFAVARLNLAEEPRVRSVGKNIELAVAVPVHDAKLAPAAASRRADIEAQRHAFVVAEHAFRMQQHQLAVAARALEESEVAFLVKHHEIGKDRPCSSPPSPASCAIV